MSCHPYPWDNIANLQKLFLLSVAIGKGIISTFAALTIINIVIERRSYPTEL